MKRSILLFSTIFLITIFCSFNRTSAQGLFQKKYVTGSGTTAPGCSKIMYSPWDSGYFAFETLYIPLDTGAIFTSFDINGNIKNCKVYNMTATSSCVPLTANLLADTTLDLLLKISWRSYSLKLDTAGNLLRAMVYPMEVRMWNQCVHDNHIYQVGTTDDAITPGLFIKQDTSGQSLWAMSYNMNPGLILSQVIASPGGGFLLAGNSDQKLILIKTDSSGNIQWQKQYRYDIHSMYPRSLINTSDNGYILIVGEASNGNSQFLKVDSVGNVLWHFGLTGMKFQKISKHSDTSYISTGVNSGEVVSLVIDSAGNLLKSMQYSTGEINFTVDNQYSETRGLITYSESKLFGVSNGYMFLKTDTSLIGPCIADTLAPVKYSYPITDSIPGVTASPYLVIMQNITSYILVGNPNLLETDFCSPTGISEPEDKAKFSATVYPVPAIDKVIFELSGYGVEKNSIQIYDQTGRIIFSEHFTGNSFSLIRNNLPTGLYFYQLISQGQAATGKFLFEQ